jgi:hypothetical protein
MAMELLENDLLKIQISVLAFLGDIHNEGAFIMGLVTFLLPKLCCEDTDQRMSDRCGIKDKNTFI